MNSKAISHSGIVDSVERNVVHVRIVQNSACHDCKIASHCATSESKIKMIDVFTADYSQYKKNDEVEVLASASVGFTAVAYAFVMPLAAMIFSIIIAYFYTDGNEAISALAGIISLVPSFTLLYILRGKFARTMLFSIEHKQ